MITVKRNQVIIAALVVMIGVAGYLSIIDRAAAAEPEIFDDGLVFTSTGEINALIFDSGSGMEIPVVSLGGRDADGTADNGGREPGEAIFVSSSEDRSFFVQEKLDREQGRSKQREMLMEMINSANVDKDKKGECADKLLDIQSRIERETSAEAMIEAKGFGESYVRIGDETVDVIVSKRPLSEVDVAQIEDIVKRKTGMDITQIRISSIVL
jgi:stage III sporulation protein AH